MPTYEYQCDACSHRFEQFQSMKDAPLRKCPECSKLALRRLIGTGGAVIFKGSGFYQTDYRSENYRKAADADTPKTESSGESRSESKPGASSSPAPTQATASAASPAPGANNATDGTRKPARRGKEAKG